MNIALIGYGKMGKAIEQAALQHKHVIRLKITSANPDFLTSENLKECDVAIEFTGPESAPQNLETCLMSDIPVICGTTGWLHRLNEIEDLCRQRNGTFLYASNFSIGVNIFFELNRKLAKLMAGQNDYNVTIFETHHAQKKDAPSGTAITLAEQIIQESKTKKGWTLSRGEKAEDIAITAIRRDAVPGTHRIVYSSPVDDIEIIHTAHNREGFANGAILAAEYAVKNKGVLSMQDVLGI